MTKKLYEIKTYEGEFNYKERNEIVTGCAVNIDCSDPETLERFETLEEAKEAFKKYETVINGGYSGVAWVKEYWIEENVYDEDDEFVEGGDVIDVTELPYNPFQEEDEGNE